MIRTTGIILSILIWFSPVLGAEVLPVMPAYGESIFVPVGQAGSEGNRARGILSGFYQAGSGGGAPAWPSGAQTAKSVVFDFANNWGYANYIGVRSIEFYKDDVLIPLAYPDDFEVYATGSYSGLFLPKNAFVTSLSKTGAWTQTTWLGPSYAGNENRLVIVFNTPTEFDKVVINNNHTLGGVTNAGAKYTTVTSSTDEITSTVYGEAVTNGTVLFEDIIPQHSAVDEVDDYILYPSTENTLTMYRSVVIDIADNWGDDRFTNIRSVELYSDGVLFDVESTSHGYYFTAYQTSSYTGTFTARFAFATNLSKTGTWTSASWMGAQYAGRLNNRIICVLSGPTPIDKVVINNGHSNGGDTNIGAKNIVVTISTDVITSTVYGEAITNGTVLFDGELAEHVAADTADDQIVYDPNGQ
jgi:hypothetical protein